MAISNARNTLAFTEVDETNNPTATYVYSETQEHPNNSHEKSLSKRGRVDVMTLIFTVDMETLDID